MSRAAVCYCLSGGEDGVKGQLCFPFAESEASRMQMESDLRRRREVELRDDRRSKSGEAT